MGIKIKQALELILSLPDEEPLEYQKELDDQHKKMDVSMDSPEYASVPKKLRNAVKDFNEQNISLSSIKNRFTSPQRVSKCHFQDGLNLF